MTNPIVRAAAGSVGFALDLEHFERKGFPDVADRVAEAVTPAVLRAVADLASACLDCNEIHKWRQVSEDGEVFRGTWASERDGHCYRRRQGADLTEWLRGLAAEVEELHGSAEERSDDPSKSSDLGEVS
jgi:hypothetical protein